MMRDSSRYELSNRESAIFIVRIKPNQPTKECGISTLSEVFVLRTEKNNLTFLVYHISPEDVKGKIDLQISKASQLQTRKILALNCDISS